MPRSAKNPLLKKSATQNERNFRVDFYAEDAIRLSPYKDDKLKYAENTPFWAGSDYFRLPKRRIGENGLFFTIISFYKNSVLTNPEIMV